MFLVEAPSLKPLNLKLRISLLLPLLDYHYHRHYTHEYGLGTISLIVVGVIY